MVTYPRGVADAVHLTAVAVVLVRGLRSGRFDRLLSTKSQVVLLLSFCCRYMDLFVWGLAGHSAYAVFYRLLFIVLTAVTVVLMVLWRPGMVSLQLGGREREGGEGEEDNDVLPLAWVLVPALVLAMLSVRALRALELLWAFSIFAEALSFLPQYVLLERTRAPEKELIFVRLYLTAFAVYRILYLANWVVLIVWHRNWPESAKLTIVAGALINGAIYSLWHASPQLFNPATNRSGGFESSPAAVEASAPQRV